MLILLSPLAIAQVDVPDDGFRQCLIDNYDMYMTGDSKIDTNNSPSLTTMTCDSYDIENLSGIEYFSSLGQIDFDSNNISNLTPLGNLENLHTVFLRENNISNVEALELNDSLRNVYLSGNNISSIPNFNTEITTLALNTNQISGTVDISMYNKLEALFLNHNDIIEIVGLGQLLELEKFQAIKNRLSQITGLQNCMNLRVLRLNHNQITRIDSLTNKPQLNIVSLIDNNLEVLPIIDLNPTVELRVQNNYLTFEDLDELADTSVLNNIAAFEYDSQKAISVPWDSVYYNGEEVQFQVSFDQTLTNNSYAWYKDGVLLDSGVSNSFTMASLSLDNEGAYLVRVYNPMFPDLTVFTKIINVKVIMDVRTESPLAFSPDGDGVSDEFYLDKEALFKIYNRSSRLVRTIQGPAFWDGTTDSNELLPTDIYYIFCDDIFYKKVSIVR